MIRDLCGKKNQKHHEAVLCQAQGVPFSSSMNLGLGNLGNLGNLGLGGLGGLGLNKGKADSVFGPVNFKFLGDCDTLLGRHGGILASDWGAEVMLRCKGMSHEEWRLLFHRAFLPGSVLD